MESSERATFTERTRCLSCGNEALEELSSGRFDSGVVQKFISEDAWGEHPAPFLKGSVWALVSCKACNLKFHKYILSPEWNERRFERWMSQEAIEEFERPLRTQDALLRRGSEHAAHVLRIERLTRALRKGSATRLLDFGCGYGDFLSVASSFGFEAYGVDRAAAKRDHGMYRKVFAEIADASALAPFHAITLFEVLEHLDDPCDILKSLSSLLRTGGILVVETPDCGGIRDIVSMDDYRKIHPLEHINAFTPTTLQDIVSRQGFIRLGRAPCVVACGVSGISRSIAKAAKAVVKRPTTQMYFRKL